MLLFEVYSYFKGAIAAIHLRGTVIISGDHLYSSPFFRGIELIRNFSCSHPFNELHFFCYKRAIAAAHSFKYTVFAEQELQQQDIIVTNHDTSLVSGMYLLQEACYLTASVAAIHFFHGIAIISRKHLDICQGPCLYFTRLHAVIHYNKRSVVDSRKFEGYVYLRKTIAALLF